jgi:folate-binding protein YgfZ
MNTTTSAGETLLMAYSVSGPDHVEFLQGQLTQDVRRVAAGEAMAMAASCDPKGRVLAALTLVASPDGMLVWLRRDVGPAWAKRLLMYRLRAKVDIHEATAAAAIAVPADRLPAQSPAATLLPAETLGARQSDDRMLTVRRLNEIAEVYAADGEAIEALAPEALSAAAWQAARIRAGVPDPGPDTVGEYTPHMLNLEQLGAVSFSKGCYTGQEIVARTEHLGKVKRRMFLVAVPAGARLGEGEDVLDNDGRRAGGIVTAAGDVGLAVLREERALAPGLTTQHGDALTVTPLIG